MPVSGRFQVTFRKKPPRQIGTDRERAEERQTETNDQAIVSEPCDCSVSLCMPTPPVSRTDIDTKPTGKQPADSTRETREKEAQSCFQYLFEPDPDHDPEYSATTLPSAADKGTSKKKTESRSKRGSRSQNLSLG